MSTVMLIEPWISLHPIRFPDLRLQVFPVTPSISKVNVFNFTLGQEYKYIISLYFITGFLYTSAFTLVDCLSK